MKSPIPTITNWVYQFYRLINLGLSRIGITLILLLLTPISLLSQENRNLIGNLSDEDIIIEADRQSSNGTGEIFSAYGNVKITFPKKEIYATSRQAQYLQKEGILVLTGDVDLIRNGKASLHGERLVYSLKEDQLTIDPKQDSQVLFRMNLLSEDLNQGNMLP